jgi:hypothetical protein
MSDIGNFLPMTDTVFNIYEETRAARTGQQAKDTRTGYHGQESLGRTAETEQPEQDNHIRTGLPLLLYHTNTI